jgi:hypothetical protein
MLDDAIPAASDVDRFVIEKIDSVPHLEALLLLWRSAPAASSAEQIARDLYIPAGQASGILDDLQRHGLISRSAGPGQDFFYDPALTARNRLLQAVDITYRSELIRISGMIHSKSSRGMRAFADAFRFRKDRP